jgi:hypothetical protein
MDAKIALTQAHDGPEDDKPMPLLDHLIELRKRLIYALISFFAVFFGAGGWLQGRRSRHL